MRLAEFMAVYKEELERAVREHPDEYHYPFSDVPTVVARMGAAIEKGSFNKDGRAFKGTCKRLGIKHTYAAIAAWLKGN